MTPTAYPIRLRAWFFCGCLATMLWVAGQTKALRFQHLTTEDGLAQNMVDCMLQDAQGFMWFGTWNGLCRYDGYTFEIFNTETAQANPLGSNLVYALEEDRFGNLWVGTKKGLYVYLYDQRQFRHASELLTGADTAELHAAVQSIQLHQDSVLLVGSGAGLSRWVVRDALGNLVAKDFLPFRNETGGLWGTTVYTILEGQDGHLLIGTDAGLHRYNTDLKNITRWSMATSPALPNDQVFALLETPNGMLWVGTGVGLAAYRDGRQVALYQTNLNDPNSLPHNTVMDMMQTETGDIQLATLGGFSVLNPEEGRFYNYRNEFNARYSLSNDFVNCLLKDGQGNIWIGTERGGINFYNTDQNKFEHLEFNAGAVNGLSHPTINSVYEDNHLWIGTAGGGLNKLDTKTGRYTHYRVRIQQAGSLSSNFVTSILRDQKGRLWVGTWGMGLNVLRREGEKSEYFEQVDAPTSNFVSSMAEDRDGHLWVGTLMGLSVRHAETGVWEPVFPQMSGFKSGVGCLLFDQEQNLWVGTRSGLFHVLFDRERHITDIRRYENDPANPKSLSGNYVISLLQDKEGSIWVGTYGNGLNRLHREGNEVRFENITSAKGLSNNIVYAILEDHTGNLWMSTDYGLSCLDPKSGKVRNFYVSDGLLNNQFYWSAGFKNKSGKLYFGGMNGLDAFYPEWINEIGERPRVVITDIRLLNESVVPGQLYNGVEVLRQAPSKVNALEVAYQEKNIGIEFSALNYQEPKLIRYAYMLEGLETQWNYVASSRRYASYTNLRPGSYTFKVRASASNGEFLGEPTVIHLCIDPPFWDTIWFKTLCCLALAGMVVGYIRFRTFSLKRQKMVLERQVKERTIRINEQKEALAAQAAQLQQSNGELEQKQSLIEGQNQMLESQNREILQQRDKLIELNKKVKMVSQLRLSFFTNISHEFRTPLTLIIGPLEKLLRENDFNEETSDTLNIVNRNAQRLLHLINQIMDFRKIEKGRMELHVTRGHLSDFCTNIFRAFEPLARIKQVEFIYREMELPDEVWFDAAKMENMLYNLLSNAFKYTPNGGKITFEIRGLSVAESRLAPAEIPDGDTKQVISIRVVDTGIGISQENLPLIFKRFYRIESEEAFKIGGSGIGLALTEELVRTHHGDIFVESKLGAGSVFEIQFPCLKDYYATDEITGLAAGESTIGQQVELLKEEFLLAAGAEAELEQPVQRIEGRPDVLLVEDNLDLRKFISHRLNKVYNIREANNGREGIELARKYNPDLIISDVMMPEVDGLELCEYLKSNLGTCHIPIILLTAKSSTEHRIEGYETGADDYLSKPFNFELLEARVHNLIESRNRLKKQFIQSQEFDVSQASLHSRDEQFLKEAMTCVENHLADPEFGVKEFVREMGVSRSLLHKKLTALTNQSAADFINLIRMKKAVQLLRQQQLNVSEVAYAVGYNDPKYFSRLFSRMYGQSPKEYMSTETALN